MGRINGRQRGVSTTAYGEISRPPSWLLWSVPVGAVWGLDAYHDGTIQSLPVAPRPQPFVINVGTDAQGKPVATFSRCSQTPKIEAFGSGEVGGSNAPAAERRWLSPIRNRSWERSRMPTPGPSPCAEFGHDAFDVTW